MSYQKQIERIKSKLPLAKAKDKDKTIFGAKSHKYKVKKPLSVEKASSWETKYRVQLPEDYKAFITQIGNQGKKYPNYLVDKSFAGPFYGIFPLDKNNATFVDNPKEYLQQKCTLTDISDEEWKVKTEILWKLSDAEYEKEENKLYAGILPIGSQGCTYYCGMILNGEQKGKIVYIDVDLQKPIFTSENNFLDWYERYLDEIISGQLFDSSGSFAYAMNGSEDDLFKLLAKTNTNTEITKILDAVIKLLTITTDNAKKITNLIDHSDNRIQEQALYILTKFHYKKAIPFLKGFIQSNGDAKSIFAVKAIHWYAKETANYWVKLIAKRLKTITSTELFDFSFYVITATDYDYGEELTPLLSHKDAEIRRTAFYNLGQLKNKAGFENTIKTTLKTETEVDNLIQVLQSIEALNNESFIPYYKELLNRVANDEYLISNVISLVEEIGIKHFDDAFQELFLTYFDQIEFDEFENLELLNMLISFRRIKSFNLLEHAISHKDKEVSKTAKKYLKKLKKKQLKK